MFEVGDIVEATERIDRKDRKSYLKAGEVAKITSVFETTNAQIVSIEIQDKLPMIDIVCFVGEDTPLKLKWR